MQLARSLIGEKLAQCVSTQRQPDRGSFFLLKSIFFPLKIFASFCCFFAVVREILHLKRNSC